MTHELSRGRTIATTALAVVGGTVLAVAMPDKADAAGTRPLFQLPFRCGEQWVASTRANHSPNPNSLDMVKVGGGTNGSPILASAPGTVTFADDDPGGGWMVKIAHTNGWGTSYLHMIERPPVHSGQSVTQGQRRVRGPGIGAPSWARAGNFR